MEEGKLNPAVFFCPHEDCLDYGVVGRGNVVLSHRYGKQRKYLLWCKSCERTFSEKRGTIFFGLHTPKEKVLQGLHCVAEGNTIASTARIMGTKEDTIRDWLRRAALHSEQVSQLLIRDLRLDHVELDELWSYIKKRRTSGQVSLRNMAMSGRGSRRTGRLGSGSPRSRARGHRKRQTNSSRR